MTQNGQLLLEDSGEFRFHRDTVRSKGLAARNSHKAAPTGDNFSASDTELLIELKRLRMSLAKERGVPAYVIFSNRSLIDMAARRPVNDIEFAEIFGVGEAKRRDFSKPFMTVIATFTD